MKIVTEIKSVLDELRPALQADGGDVQLVKIESGVVYVRLVGACAGCEFASATLKNLVEKAIKEKVPKIKSIVAV